MLGSGRNRRQYPDVVILIGKVDVAFVLDYEHVTRNRLPPIVVAPIKPIAKRNIRTTILDLCGNLHADTIGPGLRPTIDDIKVDFA